jgi:hypothetical protein
LVAVACTLIIVSVRAVDSSPVFRGAWPGHPRGEAQAVHLRDGLAYACVGSGLMIVDVSDPRKPGRVGHLALDGYAFEIAVSGAHAFVASFQGGLQIVDIAQPANPIRVG